MASTEIPLKSYTLSVKDIPDHPDNTISDKQRAELTERIKHLLDKHNATIVAHYYTDSDLQILADQTGGYVSDSLDMARFGHESDADTSNRLRCAFHGRDGQDPEP